MVQNTFTYLFWINGRRLRERMMILPIDLCIFWDLLASCGWNPRLGGLRTRLSVVQNQMKQKRRVDLQAKASGDLKTCVNQQVLWL